MTEYKTTTETKIDLSVLGITAEELQERVVKRICDLLIHGDDNDEEDNLHFNDKLQTLIKKKVDEKVGELAEKFVLSKVGEQIENLILQKTNQWGEPKGNKLTFQWGEPKGNKLTFVEYIIHRVDEYMREQVNYEGNPKSNNSWNWKPVQSRITYVLDKYLRSKIDTAMKQATEGANSKIVEGIKETAILKLQEIAEDLKRKNR
jgi:hypothetical protein